MFQCTVSFTKVKIYDSVSITVHITVHSMLKLYVWNIRFKVYSPFKNCYIFSAQSLGVAAVVLAGLGVRGGAPRPHRHTPHRAGWQQKCKSKLVACKAKYTWKHTKHQSCSIREQRRWKPRTNGEQIAEGWDLKTDGKRKDKFGYVSFWYSFANLLPSFCHPFAILLRSLERKKGNMIREISIFLV